MNSDEARLREEYGKLDEGFQKTMHSARAALRRGLDTGYRIAKEQEKEALRLQAQEIFKELEKLDEAMGLWGGIGWNQEKEHKLKDLKNKWCGE